LISRRIIKFWRIYGNGEIKFLPFHVMKSSRESRKQLHSFLNSVLENATL
jgi:hypothetical protein